MWAVYGRSIADLVGAKLSADELAMVSALLGRLRQPPLDAALGLLVDAGETLTMSAVAQRASCSKETLYKWFGGRDGLLTATVQWQASKVRVARVGGKGLDWPRLTASLERFALDWLKVMSGDTSVALNRVAVARPVGSGQRRDLGAIVLENGRSGMAGG